MAEKQKKMTDEDLVSLVNQEFETAMGVPGGEISDERAEAWRYYLGEPFGNEVEDESQVVTSEVEDTVDGIVPAMLRMFTTQDNLLSFEPVGAEDEAASQQESDYVNHVFFKEVENSFEVLYNWIFDALAQKNGIVKAYWDVSERVSSETYEGLSEDDILELMEDDELEMVEFEERKAETVVGAEAVTETVFDAKFRRVAKSGRCAVDNIPPNEYRISNDANRLNPARARMVGHERTVTRSDLLEMKFDEKKVQALTPQKQTIESTEEASRKNKTDDQKTPPERLDKSQDEFLLREAYIRVDRDGDGRAELKQVFTVGSDLLEESDADRQPFHVICPHPLPHKHFGRASAEKAMQSQLVTSTLLRQILMNLYHTNRPRHGVYEQAMGDTTMDDLLTTKVGTVTRFARPMNEAYQAMTVPFTAGASFPMLEYFNRATQKRTGVGSDSEGLEPDALKNIQTTVLAQASDMSKMKIEAIARIFAETGFKSLFLHIHELLLKHQTKVERVKLRGQYVSVKPTEWKTRRNMTVNIGLGMGTREQKLIHLDAIWDKQSKMVEAGGLNLTVTPKNIYNTAVEYVRNANFKVPAMFFTDPGNKEAPPPSSEQEKLQQAQLQVQQRQQQLDAQENSIKIGRLENERDANNKKHDREMAEIRRKQEKDKDELMVALEKISNTLTQMELDSGRDIPGSKV